MKLLILSDSHGDTAALQSAIAANEDAQAVFFLGDGLQDFRGQEALLAGRPLYAVHGNCDFSHNAEAEGFVTLCGHRFFFCHGHGYAVKMTLQPMKKAARQREADVVLYGHTHIPYYEYDNGLYVFNPGALAGGRALAPCYGVIQIEEDTGRIYFSHVELLGAHKIANEQA